MQYRKDKYGNPRQLHLKKALDVLNCEKYDPMEFLEKSESPLPGFWWYSLP